MNAGMGEEFLMPVLFCLFFFSFLMEGRVSFSLLWYKRLIWPKTGGDAVFVIEEDGCKQDKK